MRDVAALAGVGLKTVSRVINAEPGVSDARRDRVLRAARQLDYQPNLTAGSLRRGGGKTATIGTILENVANPFSAALQGAVEEVANAHGSLVFAASANEDGERERALVSSFVGHRVDGLIIAPAATDHSYLAGEVRSGLHVVFVDRRPKYLNADAVVTANSEGALAATRHLIGVGHRRIAFLADDPAIDTAADRLAGYRSALAAAGIGHDPEIVRVGLGSLHDAEAAVRDLLAADDPPTALFTAQNLITEGALRALQALDQASRIALVGFDDFPMADRLMPAVTVVAQDPARMGRMAAEILFGRLQGDDGPPRTQVLATELITRGSGEIAPHSARA